jgi:hypothetical protein
MYIKYDKQKFILCPGISFGFVMDWHIVRENFLQQLGMGVVTLHAVWRADVQCAMWLEFI